MSGKPDAMDLSKVEHLDRFVIVDPKKGARLYWPERTRLEDRLKGFESYGWYIAEWIDGKYVRCGEAVI